MSSSPPLRELARELRRAADAYTAAQRVRLETAARIRAALREEWGGRPDDAGAAPLDAVLAAVRRGEHDGPLPELGRELRRQWQEEQEIARGLEERLERHPAWPWLRRVRGLGVPLAGQLVARLDVIRAETPSSFWAYCGLATVPGIECRCPVCGLSGAFPEQRRASRQHSRPGGTEPCPGRLEPVPGSGPGVRVAQPRPSRGERAAYDEEAKRICYQIGTSLVRAGGAFERYYHGEREKLDGTRPGWADDRKHLTALRKVEKLFLAHLWIVWRQALDLPLTRPFAHAQEEHHDWTDPWEMVEEARPRRWSRAAPAPLGSRGSG